MPSVNVRIRRQASPDREPYIDAFRYSGDTHITVLALLEWRNAELAAAAARDDADAGPDAETLRPIVYDCSCEQALCGACAMVINGVPRLACHAFCDEVADQDGLLIEPLSKFPLVSDLAVDREILFARMRELSVWLEGEAKQPRRNRQARYEAAQCLQCGCCLEACPTYASGDLYISAAGAVNAMNMLSLNRSSPHKAELRRHYRQDFYRICAKTGACQTVCPADLPVLGLIAEANRLSVWKLWQLLVDRDPAAGHANTPQGHERNER